MSRFSLPQLPAVVNFSDHVASDHSSQTLPLSQKLPRMPAQWRIQLLQPCSCSLELQDLCQALLLGRDLIIWIQPDWQILKEIYEQARVISLLR